LQLSLGKREPIVYKFLDGNIVEKKRLNLMPKLNINHTKEGDCFIVDDMELCPIETPGHLSDHLCFLLKNGEEYNIFTGDHIIGADSTYFTDYPKYF
jgi:glyoxylase-like metal-dependent hydrolase (beta-lactamase superfamily II)